MTRDEIEELVRAFEARTLPKAQWTHHAHLTVGAWYLSRLSREASLVQLRRCIRAYNESVGTANTDSSGYHETLTCLYLDGIAQHLSRHVGVPFDEQVELLVASPMGASDWPLRFYSRKRLFSVDARRRWVEPDLAGVDDNPPL